MLMHMYSVFAGQGWNLLFRVIGVPGFVPMLLCSNPDDPVALGAFAEVLGVSGTAVRRCSPFPISENARSCGI